LGTQWEKSPKKPSVGGYFYKMACILTAKLTKKRTPSDCFLLKTFYKEIKQNFDNQVKNTLTLI